MPRLNLHGPQPHSDTEQRQHLARLLIIAALSGFAFFVPMSLTAGETEPSARQTAATLPDGVNEFRSRHFTLITDLDELRTAATLKRMELTLSAASRYWAADLPGRIKCFLVEEIDNWDTYRFPESTARLVLKTVEGGTDVVSAVGRRRRHAIIYATATPGVIEHEVVHAYCFQTFGRGGPDWYREGMAELFAQKTCCADSTPCRASTIKLLKSETPNIRRLLKGGSFTQPLQVSLNAKANRDSNTQPIGTTKLTAASNRSQSLAIGTAWDETLSAESVEIWKHVEVTYAQSWALCYLMYHNKSYSNRFRAMGRHMLSGAPATFADAFGSQLDELDFELQRFAQHVHGDYEVKLCRWDWHPDFVALKIGQSKIVRLSACNGFQATRVRMKQGEELRVEATGTWTLALAGLEIDANGNPEGQGRLVGALLDNFCVDICHRVRNERFGCRNARWRPLPAFAEKRGTNCPTIEASLRSD